TLALPESREPIWQAFGDGGGTIEFDCSGTRRVQTADVEYLNDAAALERVLARKRAVKVNILFVRRKSVALHVPVSDTREDIYVTRDGALVLEERNRPMAWCQLHRCGFRLDDIKLDVIPKLV